MLAEQCSMPAMLLGQGPLESAEPPSPLTRHWFHASVGGFKLKQVLSMLGDMCLPYRMDITMYEDVVPSFLLLRSLSEV
jgi:hypothetical protein